MKILGRKTVIEYKYDSKEEAERHEKIMEKQGWQKEAVSHLLIPHFRSYSQRHKVGSFL